MKIVWSRRAIGDLSALHDHIACDDPNAARNALHRIVSLVEDKLLSFPEIGRPGRVDGTRELVVPGTPFIAPYRVKPGGIDVLRVHHAARRWSNSL